eukprot:3925372-Pyramimonas_sp.AAC.1
MTVGEAETRNASAYPQVPAWEAPRARSGAAARCEDCEVASPWGLTADWWHPLAHLWNSRP